MKKNLKFREYIYVASMLFGLFFGAGNLIFPIHMGQMAGSNLWPAVIGFLVTGVGLPLLSVAALGISRSDGLFDLSSKVCKPYAMFFTCLLYLTIGPFFAIPRCATTSFTVGMQQILPQNDHNSLYLLIFTLLFFVVALIFSLFPGKILTWVGKILNPVFLAFLGVLVVVAMISPSASLSSVVPEGDYATQPFFRGFLEGYNTMDVLAGLAFGIIVVDVIRSLGIKQESAIAKNTVLSGVFSSLLMALIYIAVSVVGTQSRGLFATSENGGIAFAQIAEHYLGKPGLYILAATVTFACLKTAIGLITSCAETFSSIFKKGPTYRIWAIIFSVVSFLIANLGLDSIIKISIPVLMFLYPLAIVLVLLALFGKLFSHDRLIYCFVTGFTLIPAIYDLLAALPAEALTALSLDSFLAAAQKFLPLSKFGLGWVCPAAVGLFLGLIIRLLYRKKSKRQKTA